MSLSPSEIIENPCEEIIPTKPFPFKSDRISHSIKFFHYLIFFPFYVEYKKIKHLYTFNLETREWSSIALINSPEILEKTNNYTVSLYLENHFVLFGCYKTFAAARTNNLFSQSQQATLNSVLGFIETKFSEGKLTLVWKESPTTGLPYLEKFSTNPSSSKIFIFGGYDENGKVSNDLYQIDFGDGKTTFELRVYGEGKVTKMQLVDEQGQNNPIPARANHGSYFYAFCEMRIFGGEDQDSNEINDIWEVSETFKYNEHKCVKLYKQTISRRPKLGTPCVWFNNLLFYIGKSSSEVIAPIRSYLCIEEFYEEPKNQTQTYSSKKFLPFDGVPHTFELFKDKLLIGFGSSLYTIRIQDKNATWSVDDNFGIKPFDSDDVSLVKKRKEASFKDHMREYFVERPHPDICFKVQDQEVTAHRGILSVRSRYFNDLFTNEEKDKDLKNPIEILDLSPAAFNILLEWLYCNNILEMKEDAALELFKAADKYLVPKLKDEAEKNLVKNLTLENLIEHAKLAVDSKAKDLENAVVKLAAKEIDVLNEREQLNLLPSSIIYKVFKSGK